MDQLLILRTVRVGLSSDRDNNAVIARTEERGRPLLSSHTPLISGQRQETAH